MRQPTVMVVVTMVGLTVAGAASAAPASDADRLYEEGQDLAAAQRYEEACERFAQSHEIEHTFGTVVQLAGCAEREGRTGRAWFLYDTAAKIAEQGGPKSEAIARFVRERADRLKPKLAAVVVKFARPDLDGLSFRVGDNRLVPAPEVRTYTDPGDVELVMGRNGITMRREMLHGVAGGEVTVDLSASAFEIVRPPDPPGLFYALLGVGYSVLYGDGRPYKGTPGGVSAKAEFGLRATDNLELGVRADAAFIAGSLPGMFNITHYLFTAGPAITYRPVPSIWLSGCAGIRWAVRDFTPVITFPPMDSSALIDPYIEKTKALGFELGVGYRFTRRLAVSVEWNGARHDPGSTITALFELEAL